MIEAVFISDLHLHPQQPAITARFNRFIDWAAVETKAVFILGDFFHVWVGDDAINDWHQTIIDRLIWLQAQGVRIYFMPGNRDFLLGSLFAQLSGIIRLTEPYHLKLGDDKVLLVHGDRYCTQDKSHQWLRRLTRNQIFPKLFLQLPLSFRLKLVNHLRQTSGKKSMSIMHVVPKDLLNDMIKHQVNVVIHGHTHKPGLTPMGEYRQYVLSDWDDNPLLLCYHSSYGLYFIPLKGV